MTETGTSEKAFQNNILTFFTSTGYTERKNSDILTRTDLLKKPSERVGSKLVESQLKILILIKEKPGVSKRELSEIIGLSSTAVDKNIAKLKSLGVLKRTGPDKGGYWEVVE